MSTQQHKQEEVGQQQFVDVADVNDVPAGKIKHIEVGEKQILLANSEGKVYALCDRCSHMNAVDGCSERKGRNMPYAWG
jgi:nitrite reductase/ring-hydroxylating ferredoxin subunit